MRDIYFRGKSLVDPSWQYGNLEIIKDLDNTSALVGNIEVDIASVGQYTGLNDNRGANIYEFDVIENSLGCFEVYWDVHGRWAVKQLLINGAKVSKGTNLYTMGSDYMVIGNIVDGTDLRLRTQRKRFGEN